MCGGGSGGFVQWVEGVVGGGGCGLCVVVGVVSEK